MHLLIDNSNTRTKLALAEGEHLHDWRVVIPTAELSQETLTASLAEVNFTQATICSVVPPAADLLERALPVPVHRMSCHSQMPIRIDYPQPEQIGADRLANAVAAHHFHDCPVIVIDFGTAVTFDIISEQAAYLGGAIAPGTAALRDYLHRRTALLPAIQLEEPARAIGKSTEEAMQVGAVIGYRGLIRGILEAISAELDGEPTVVATGGDASLIAAQLTEVDHVDRDLTLHGIRLVGQTNPKK